LKRILNAQKAGTKKLQEMIRPFKSTPHCSPEGGKKKEKKSYYLFVVSIASRTPLYAIPSIVAVTSSPREVQLPSTLRVTV
jgi:hypothetical protein